MAPKNKLANGFMTFVQEWRQKNAGGPPMTLPQAINSCSVLWNVLTQEERSVYVEKANVINLELRRHRNRRLLEMDLAQREAEELLEKMKRATETMVMEAVEADDLENKKFVFVSFNFFTKTASGDLYVPAEFSACQFSLRQGIVSGYTTLINPGSIDLGQACDALHHSTTTHNLPLPPHALGESDVNKLYREIHDYLSGSSDFGPIVVFTKGEAVAKVKASLYDLKVKSNHQGQEILVHDLEYLLFCLKKQALQIAGLPADDVTELGTEAYLRKDSFEFSKHIACEYHEDIDRSQYCAQSIVRRWVFTACKLLCEDLNIPKIPDKHLPRVENSYPDPENDNESSVEVTKSTCLAGFGRGRARGRLPTLGKANR